VVDTTEMDTAGMDTTVERLLRQAYLFDDPSAYRAGVEDAAAAVRDLLRSGPTPTPQMRAVTPRRPARQAVRRTS